MPFKSYDDWEIREDESEKFFNFVEEGLIVELQQLFLEGELGGKDELVCECLQMMNRLASAFV